MKKKLMIGVGIALLGGVSISSLGIGIANMTKKEQVQLTMQDKLNNLIDKYLSTKTNIQLYNFVDKRESDRIYEHNKKDIIDNWYKYVFNGYVKIINGDIYYEKLN